MKAIHLANTDFEFELADSRSVTIEQALTQIPLCLQLQFMPLLYARTDEGIAVTALPSADFIDHLLQLGLWRSKNDLPSFIPLDTSLQFKQIPCISWGFSKRVHAWASDRDLFYPIPDWEIVKRVNSKLFSFLENPSLLEGAALLWNEKELKDWLKNGQKNRVLKTCFGLSGRGNYCLQPHTSFSQIQAFCLKEWQCERPIIAEPWLDRVLDFSTQWEIEPQGPIQFIGATVFKADAKGTYLGTQAGPEECLFKDYLPFLQQHKQLIYPVLQKIAALGFFGSIGIDAFVYRQEKELYLRPLVEINGRKTMSVAALQFQKRWFPEQFIQLAFYKTGEQSNFLLPMHLKGASKEISFGKTLVFSFC